MCLVMVSTGRLTFTEIINFELKKGVAIGVHHCYTLSKETRSGTVFMHIEVQGICFL